MKKIILAFIFTLTLYTAGFTQGPNQSFWNDTIGITTYYPSPHGVYGTMRLYPGQEPTEGVAPGVIYYNETEDMLKFHNNTTWVNVTGGGGGGQLKGDVDADGQITMTDALYIWSYSMHQPVTDINGQTPSEWVMDVNNDGQVNNLDNTVLRSKLRTVRTYPFEYISSRRNDYPAAKIEQENSTGTALEINSTGKALIVYRGNVGIGVSEPSQRLDVNGIVQATDICTASGICLSTLGAYAINTNNTMYNEHTLAQCNATGGNPVDVGAYQKICQFTNNAGVSCPTGWKQYLYWTTTDSVSCVVGVNSCRTPSHGWALVQPESCCVYVQSVAGGYVHDDCIPCYATITQVGCY